MNKGRNFMILMACLLTLSLLTFLTRTKMENTSGVVDQVRYILKSTTNNVTNYEFYFTDKMVMTGILEKDSGKYELSIYIRGEYDKTIKDYLSTTYAYHYTIEGTERSNASVSWSYDEDADENEKTNSPYERITPNVMIAMIFGETSYISLWQAILVAVIAAAGGLIIAKAEELWHIINHRPDNEDPKWDDMTNIKRTGTGILIFDAVLLLVFIFI